MTNKGYKQYTEIFRQGVKRPQLFYDNLLSETQQKYFVHKDHTLLWKGNHSFF